MHTTKGVALQHFGHTILAILASIHLVNWCLHDYHYVSPQCPCIFSIVVAFVTVDLPQKYFLAHVEVKQN